MVVNLATIDILKVFRHPQYNNRGVNIASFEKWYANQAKYRKVTGEEPGQELKKWSLSPSDISELLEIAEYRVYDLIKEKNWETVMVDYWMRITKESFFRWYEGQKHYRTREDRLRDQDLEESTITFPQAAKMIGLTRKQFYPLLRDERYSHFFDFVELAGRRRITKESFQCFLEGQEKYHLVPEPVLEMDEAGKPEDAAEMAGKEDPGIAASEPEPSYLTVAEAAQRANVSRQLIARYASRGYFGECRQGGLIRIPKTELDNWMKKRQEEVDADGID